MEIPVLYQIHLDETTIGRYLRRPGNEGCVIRFVLFVVIALIEKKYQDFLHQEMLR